MIVAVDTGGTKTLVAAFSDNRRLHKKHRFETPKNPQQYLEILAELITTNYDIKKITALSIAIPGSIKDQIILQCPNLGWQNVPIIELLRKKLSYKGPVFLENDANLAGLGETHSRTPLPYKALYVTISTGIGTGVITHGYIDPELRTSEGGHMLLEYDGLLQVWEYFASGRAIYETYGKYARDIHDRQTWEEIADKIARGLYALIPVLQPTIIIIGGSIGTHFQKFHQPLQTIVAENLSTFIDCPTIVAAKHPEEAVLYGCHVYATQQLA